MKKIIPFLVMLLVATFTVGAAVTEPTGANTDGFSSYTVTGTDTLSVTGNGAAAKVTLDLLSADNSVVELWFATAEPADGARMPESTTATVNLKRDADSVEYSNDDSPLYACWYIQGGLDVKADLEIVDALKADSGDDSISWTVKNTTAQINLASNGTKSTSDGDGIVSYTKGAEAASGSVKLDIATNQGDFSEITPASYSGYLTLKVRSNG